jgi:hypothetical protein
MSVLSVWICVLDSAVHPCASLPLTHRAIGNLATADTDSFTFDWGNRMTSATVGRTSVSYAYDGLDTRVSETTGGVTTSYLWDRKSSLPLLVSDGCIRDLHAGGILAEIDAANAARFHLTDALGTVHGLTTPTRAFKT